MNKTILAILFILGIQGCKSRISDSPFSGHWGSCSENGDYIEIHFKNNEYKFSTDFGLVTNWNEFRVKGDTFIQHDKFLIEDSTVIRKAIYVNNEKDVFIVEYFNPEEKWTWHRLEKDIKNMENNASLLKETIQRSKIRKCIDKRPIEERKRDSTSTEIDFQF